MSNWRNGDNRYGLVTMAFHWITLGFVVLMVALGLWMEGLSDGSYQRFQALQLHKSVGITVLSLTLARLVWRRIDRPLPPPTSLSDWQKLASGLLHWALYVLLLAVPLAGWATASASTLDLPTRLYGVLPWPDLPFTTVQTGSNEDQKALELLFHDIHVILIISLMSLIAIHVVAALWHHYGLKDDTLSRMLPSQKQATPISGEET